MVSISDGYAKNDLDFHVKYTKIVDDLVALEISNVAEKRLKRWDVKS